MNKKPVFFGMLVMVLAWGLLFAACENPVQEVEGNVGISNPKANPVASVAAGKTTAGTEIIVKWDAVEGASTYTLYYQQEGKKTAVSVGTSAQNSNTYADDGSSLGNADVDKWSAKFTKPTAFITGQKYRFGVRTTPLATYTAVSNIVWSSYVQF
jgi:hypothetical protein